MSKVIRKYDSVTWTVSETAAVGFDTFWRLLGQYGSEAEARAAHPDAEKEEVNEHVRSD